MLKCEICAKHFNHLGSHVWHKHKITARDYKTMFELPWKMSLISEEVKQKKRDAFDPVSLKNLTTEHSFKKGNSGHRRISEHERKTILARINDVNTTHLKPIHQCPVCKMKFKHLESHLYNKHNLLLAPK